MGFLLELALSNVLVAGLLAVLAGLAGLWGRRPAITHALWLLVMIKLITPPLVEFPIPWLETPPASALARQEPVAQAKPKIEPNELPGKVEETEILNAPPMVMAEREAETEPVVPEQPKVAVEPAPQSVSNPPRPVAPAQTEATDRWTWSNLVLIVWLSGSCVWLTVALRRLWRFQRLLRFAQAAPTHVQTMARDLADCLGVRCPTICVLPGSVSPMLWALGRSPKLLLPAGLLERLSAPQLATLLAHELAHWRRRDDRVRWLELAVLALFWWCPLAWWARRELHQAEEECCDAWVVSLTPESARDYALALVETVEFLSAAPAPMPVLASGLGRVRLLKRRLTMILQGKTPRSLTFTGLAAVAGVGLLALPMIFSRTANVQVGAQPDEKKFDRKKDGPRDGKKQPPEQARDEVQRLQEEIQQRQQELQRMMQRLQQIQQQNQGGGQRGGDGQQGGAGQQGGNQKKGGPGGPGGFPGGPGGGGFPGGGGGGGWGPGGGFGGNPFGRINELEKKLDLVLQELRALRNEIRPGGKGPGPKGPGAGPDRRPGDPNSNPPQPPRFKDGGKGSPRPDGGANPPRENFERPDGSVVPPPPRTTKPRDDE